VSEIVSWESKLSLLKFFDYLTETYHC